MTEEAAESTAKTEKYKNKNYNSNHWGPIKPIWKNEPFASYVCIRFPLQMKDQYKLSILTQYLLKKLTSFAVVSFQLQPSTTQQATFKDKLLTVKMRYQNPSSTIPVLRILGQN